MAIRDRINHSNNFLHSLCNLHILHRFCPLCPPPPAKVTKYNCHLCQNAPNFTYKCEWNFSKDWLKVLWKLIFKLSLCNLKFTSFFDVMFFDVTFFVTKIRSAPRIMTAELSNFATECSSATCRSLTRISF